jgi:hypothetical protein
MRQSTDSKSKVIDGLTAVGQSLLRFSARTLDLSDLRDPPGPLDLTYCSATAVADFSDV